MSQEKFKKLSRTLSEQGFPKHIILIQEGDEMIAYTDPLYFRQQDLKKLFLNLANVSSRQIDDDRK